MTIEQLQSAIHAAPFKPFSLHTADGRALHVPHPDFIAHNPKGRTAVVLSTDDSFMVVDLLLVVSLDFEGQEIATRD